MTELAAGTTNPERDAVLDLLAGGAPKPHAGRRGLDFEDGQLGQIFDVAMSFAELGAMPTVARVATIAARVFGGDRDTWAAKIGALKGGGHGG